MLLRASRARANSPSTFHSHTSLTLLMALLEQGSPVRSRLLAITSAPFPTTYSCVSRVSSCVSGSRLPCPAWMTPTCSFSDSLSSFSTRSSFTFLFFFFKVGSQLIGHSMCCLSTLSREWQRAVAQFGGVGERERESVHGSCGVCNLLSLYYLS